MGSRALDTLRRAASDRRSGSADVARAAAGAIGELGGDAARIADAARVLLDGQPFMAACVRLADEILGAQDARAAAGQFAQRLERERTGLAANLETYLPRKATVLTVSFSTTVVESLAVRRGINVLCAASEPGAEGHAAARRLRERGLRSEVVGDSAVCSAAARADLVLVGADAVGPSAFLNKAGSLAAILGAREADVPRIVLAGTSKFVDANAWTAMVARLPGVPPLDAVPLRRLTAILTEDGPLQPAAARRLATRSRVHSETLKLLV